MTPSFRGWTTRMWGGVRPSIALASLPTAMTERSVSSMATMDGSRRTTPSPRTNTRVFAVPRSIARSRENARKNITGSAKRVPGVRRQPEEISARRPGRSGRGGPYGFEELVARERLVEEAGPRAAERLVRLGPDRPGSDEDEAAGDGVPAGRGLVQEVEPVHAVEVEVGDHQVDAGAQLLARLVGAGDGEGRAAGGLEVLEQDLLHRLVVLHDEDPLAVEPDGLPAALRDCPGSARPDRQLDGEDRPVAGPALGRDVAAVLANDSVGDAEPQAGAGGALGGHERVEDRRQNLGGNSRARVFHRDLDPVGA